ncbi:hypothetical protein FHU36_003876 [Nonomuraea muscovyensis]|uniref:Uncharacterized protein n=1 Tax=Nonomuraea muscovyensis TaxID=1124761 RepID=A0A7X0F046_9ACTN|nr:hypothetical protein [Nonomuraea muscovyensis]MBB6347331.1 hypothetical protein [Nonomuraea muscovyensis]
MVASFMIAVPSPWRRPLRAASPLLRTPPRRSDTASRTSSKIPGAFPDGAVREQHFTLDDDGERSVQPLCGMTCLGYVSTDSGQGRAQGRDGSLRGLTDGHGGGAQVRPRNAYSAARDEQQHRPKKDRHERGRRPAL